SWQGRHISYEEILIGSIHGHKILGISMSNGELLWEVKTENRSVFSFDLYNDKIILLDSVSLKIINPLNGICENIIDCNDIWRKNDLIHEKTILTVIGKIGFTTNNQKQCVQINIDDGNPVWIDINGEKRFVDGYSPIVAGNLLFLKYLDEYGVAWPLKKN
ncbi:MAG: hypothetical protein L6Q97_07330, partial [Thermoanaerobaculia bacterium]|nr:hypothetical protein [Thermoanaerobaculia bacterium]